MQWLNVVATIHHCTLLHMLPRVSSLNTKFDRHYTQRSSMQAAFVHARLQIFMSLSRDTIDIISLKKRYSTKVWQIFTVRNFSRFIKRWCSIICPPYSFCLLEKLSTFPSNKLQPLILHGRRIGSKWETQDHQASFGIKVTNQNNQQTTISSFTKSVLRSQVYTIHRTA